MSLKITNQMLHLPNEVHIDKVQSHPHSFELFISFPPSQERICPDCGSTRCVVKDSGRMQTVRHIAISNSGTMLTFRRRRYVCRDCGHSFYESLPWLHPTLHITTGLYLDICRDLTSVSSLYSIALRHHVTESIVTSVLNSVCFGVPKTLPETLCIDEFDGSTGFWNPSKNCWDIIQYHCNIADGDAGCVIDVLPHITLDDLEPYFFSFSLEQRKKVKFFCCDMHGGFITLANRCFPDVTVCIDMFHVVKLLNKNVDNIRTALQKKLQDSGDKASYRLLKHSARLLKTALPNKNLRWGDRTARNEERLKNALALSPDLQEAYSALQDFHLIMRLDSFAKQRAQLTEWLDRYASSECPSTRTACNTIRHHRRYIQNSWEYGKSNGPCEGLNKKIKDIKRNASGEHSFENFRRRILFACGYSKFVQETYTIPSEKHSSYSTGKEAGK